MIKPAELESEEGGAIWDTLTASEGGDVAMLRQLLEQNPELGRADMVHTGNPFRGA